MSAPDPIAALRTVHALLLAVDAPDALPAALLLVGAIDCWLAEGGDFAEALGLAPGWHSAMRQRERDRAIRELAGRHYPTLAGRPLARALAAAGQEYEARCWPRNRAPRHRPDGAAGLLHDIAEHGGMPSFGTLRNCIG